MNLPHDMPLTKFERLDRLHEAARIEAERLRRAALADFWRGADALLSDSMVRARRSAARLAARLTRHTALRAAPPRASH